MGLGTPRFLPAAMAALSLGATPAMAAPPTSPSSPPSQGLERLDAFVYQAHTARSPTGISRLVLTPMDAEVYALDLRIVAPNPTRHAGHIQGLATREGERYTLRAAHFIEDGSLDNPELCVLVIEADGSRARVVSADGCAGFHGAAASFLEQGRQLVRTP